jgi:hypothetical protein
MAVAINREVGAVDLFRSYPQIFRVCVLRLNQIDEVPSCVKLDAWVLSEFCYSLHLLIIAF